MEYYIFSYEYLFAVCHRLQDEAKETKAERHLLLHDPSVQENCNVDVEKGH